MARRTLMVLVATTMALLLSGCGSSQGEEQGSRQGSEQEGGSSKQTSEAMTNEQTSEPTTVKSVVGHCTDSRSTGGQREEAGRGEVSNGNIAFSGSTLSRTVDTVATNTDIHLIDGEGCHETQLTHTKQFEEDPVWSPDGKKIAFIRSNSTYSYLYVMNADGTKQTQLTK